MTETAVAGRASKKGLWTGRILSALAVLLFLFTASFTLLNPDMARQGFVHYGYPPASMFPIVLAEVACAIVYAVPQTAVLGAILMTGYLGGATATHVRAGEPFYLPITVGIVVWLGLFLREPRLRVLVPLRTSNPSS
jgi:hypothetical protein